MNILYTLALKGSSMSSTDTNQPDHTEEVLEMVTDNNQTNEDIKIATMALGL